MAHIQLNNVYVDIPIFNSQGRSLKKTFLSMTTGGKIGHNGSGKTIIRSLDNINLKIEDGERVGLLGHNGAGKSTLLRVLGKVYEPSSGSAEIKGKIGSLIDVSLGIDGELTGIENIYLRAALLQIPRQQVENNLSSIIDFSELGEFINMPVRTYSSGMHMRLAFAVSTMISPEILLMDEWLSIGDNEFQNKAETKLKKLVDRSNILVIASHSENLIRTCCSRCVLLEHGKIVKDGSTTEICDLYFKK